MLINRHLHLKGNSPASIRQLNEYTTILLVLLALLYISLSPPSFHAFTANVVRATYVGSTADAWR